MNWTQIKVIFYSLLFIVILFYVLTWVATRRMALRHGMVMAAHELVTKNNTDRVVRIESALQQELAVMLTSTTRVARFVWGDVRREIGSGKATGCVIVSNALGNRLAIRFRHVGNDKFEVLEFWTP